MIPDIEIVPHIVGYHRLFALQLSGFCLFPPRCRVLYRPCVADDDVDTLRVLEWFTTRLPATVIMEPHIMERRRANRRAIGRNECALTSQAPVVWMADVDYIATADCLDAIIEAWNSLTLDRRRSITEWDRIKLAHPARVHSSKPEHGMELLKMVQKYGELPRPLDLTTDFPETQRKRLAIGGLQFFDGPFCREHGYCGPIGKGRLFRPADRWQPTKCDKWARAAAGEDVTMPITVLYRVRHTTRSEGMPEDAKL